LRKATRKKAVVFSVGIRIEHIPNTSVTTWVMFNVLLRDSVPKMCVAADEAGPCNGINSATKIYAVVYLYDATGSAFAPSD